MSFSRPGTQMMMFATGGNSDLAFGGFSRPPSRPPSGMGGARFAI